MNGSDEKNGSVAEMPTEDEKKRIDPPFSGVAPDDPEEALPKRSVRMKWGRIVEDPEEKTATPDEKSEMPITPPPMPRPDPRIEALRERLLREEREREQRRKETEEREKVEAAMKQASTQSLDDRREKSGAKKNRKRKGAPIHQGEIARMEEELYREELRRRIRKKRRKEAVKDFFAFFIGAVLTLPKRIRISKKFIAALLLTVLLSGVSAVVLGNLLKSRVDANGDEGEESTSVGEESEEEIFLRGFDVPEVNAGIVSLEGATPKSLRGEARRFSEAGVTAVSLVLRNGDGELLFSSMADGALGIDKGDERLLPIDEILAPFLEYELYVSCLLPMRYGIDGDGYSRSVLYAYETALLSEIAEAGASEVVLLDCDSLFLRDGADLTDDTSEFGAADVVLELRSLARTVNARAPEVAVGIAFSPAFLSTRESDRYLTSIIEAFDLVLFDLREAENEKDVYEAVSSGITEHLYFVLRYSMRILIPEGSAEAVTAVSVGNWQEGTLPKPSVE